MAAADVDEEGWRVGGWRVGRRGREMEDVRRSLQEAYIVSMSHLYKKQILFFRILIVVGVTFGRSRK